jgi:hypothetical protein
MGRPEAVSAHAGGLKAANQNKNSDYRELITIV